MLKSPEKFNAPAPEKKDKSELEILNSIQVELMKRSRENEMDWIKNHSKEFRELFNANKEQFLKIHREDPSELCALIEMALTSKN